MRSIAWYIISNLDLQGGSASAKPKHLLLKQTSKLALLEHRGQDIAPSYQFAICKNLWKCRPVTILLQCLPQSVVILFIKHIDALVIHSFAFKDANHLLWEPTQWGTPWSLYEHHHLVFLHQPINKLLQWNSQLNITARCQPDIRFLPRWLPQPCDIAWFITRGDLSCGSYMFFHPWFPCLGQSSSVRFI